MKWIKTQYGYEAAETKTSSKFAITKWPGGICILYVEGEHYSTGTLRDMKDCAKTILNDRLGRLGLLECQR